MKFYVDGGFSKKYAFENGGSGGYGSFMDENGVHREVYTYDNNVRTNNEAEYQTLLNLLTYILDNNLHVTDEHIMIYTDSNLMIGQLFAGFRINKEKFVEYTRLIHQKLQQIKCVTIEWIPGDLMKEVLGH